MLTPIEKKKPIVPIKSQLNGIKFADKQNAITLWSTIM